MPLATNGPVTDIPGLRERLIETYETDSRTVDPRIVLMERDELLRLLARAKPATVDKSLVADVRQGGDVALDVLRRLLSDQQPRAISAAANAEKLRAGETIIVEAGRIRYRCDLGYDLPWLDDDRARVIVGPGDSVAPADPEGVINA